MSQDYYALLGVPRDAPMATIKKAYRALARSLHPDVVGDDPAKGARFKQVTEAYEVLGDPTSRGAYDRRFQRRTPGRMAGGFYPWEGGAQPPPPKAPDMDLDDLFGDSDFGFGGAGRKRGPRTSVKPTSAADRQRAERWKRSQSGPSPGPSPHPDAGQSSRPGHDLDIHLRADVPAHVAARGGLVTLTYMRVRLTEDRQGLAEYDELYDLRVPPGARTGNVLRVRHMGHHAGEGHFGDLVVELTVLPGQAPQETNAPVTQGPEERDVPITLAEALLGGRIRLDTATGPVTFTLPPCTSGGSRFRLRGRGAPDDQGRPRDLMVRLKVEVPPVLDDESRALVEQLVARNPQSVR